ncbi:MAG: NupC/NupG family nucleoside CNT transporter [Bacteriovoracaceae bacterium]
MERLISFVGLAACIALAYALSSNRKSINWKTVVTGVLAQLFFAIIILKTDLGQSAFASARDTVKSFLDYSLVGAEFIFGSLASYEKMGFVFFSMVLPTIIFFSSFMSVLYHLGVMQFFIKVMAWFMVKIMGTSGTESLAAAANVFAGQTEAPLVIKPYLKSMTRSELMAMMSGGMATVAGGVLVTYVGMGIDAGHLLAASVMSAPAALVCAKLMVPEVEASNTKGNVSIDLKVKSVNVIDAASQGAAEGLKLALNVAAMLVAFIALVAFLNGLLGFVGGLFGYSELSFELIMGYLFSPVAFLLGAPWKDCFIVGGLLGKKLVLNEFVAYLDLQNQMANLSPRSVIISTYALCGFANFSSIAIQIGGIGALEESKRTVLAELGMRSLIAGTLACFMTASIAGILL